MDIFCNLTFLYRKIRSKALDKDNNTMIKNDIKIELLINCQEHIPALAKLWFEEIDKHWIPNSSIQQTENNIFETVNTDKMPVTFVALYQDFPVGMAMLREHHTFLAKLKPRLRGLVVHPDYRKNNIGQMLINATKISAKKFGFNNLYLLTFDPTLPSWYETLGWKIIGFDQLFNHKITIMSVDL